MQPSGSLGRQRAGEPDEAEGTDGGDRVVVGIRAEVEGQRRPEHREEPELGGAGGAQLERQRREQQHPGNQAAPIQGVTEGHDEQHPERVPQLRRGDQPADLMSGGAEIVADHIEQRLSPVQVADCRATRHRQKEQEPSGQVC